MATLTLGVGLVWCWLRVPNSKLADAASDGEEHGALDPVEVGVMVEAAADADAANAPSGGRLAAAGGAADAAAALGSKRGAVLEEPEVAAIGAGFEGPGAVAGENP